MFLFHEVWASKASIANDILANMPKRALNVIQSSAFMGADLVKVESDIHRPSFRVGCFMLFFTWEHGLRNKARR